MILTCHDCARQLSFSGGARRRGRLARLFGWIERAGVFLCADCEKVTPPPFAEAAE